MKLIFESTKKIMLLIFLVIFSYLPGYTAYFLDSSDNIEQKIKQREKNNDQQNNLELAWLEHLYRNRNQSAIQYANKVLASDSDSYQAHELLVNIYQMQGNYEKLFPHLIAMIKHNRIENALYFPNIIYLQNEKNVVWLSQAQLSQLEKIIESKVHLGSISPLYKSYLKRLLSAIYLETGQLEKRDQLYNQFGLIKDWLVIGPFENQEKLGFDEQYGPEKSIHLKEQYKGIYRDVTWRTLNHVKSNGKVDFNNIFSPNEWACAYALTYVHSPVGRSIAIRTGSDDSIKVWMNDGLVLADETYKGFGLWQHTVAVNLNKGWNKILVKVCQGIGSWEFAMSMTDLEGNLINDLTYSLKPRIYQKVNDTLVTTNASAASLEFIYKNKLDTNQQDESSLYYLARHYKNEDKREKSIQAYEQLLKKNPNCARYWLEMGEVYLLGERPTKGLMALKKAIEVEPNYLIAHLRLAKYYHAKTMHKKSELATEAALEINPHQVEALLWEAINHGDQQQWEDAYQSTKIAYKNMPELSWISNAMGMWAEKQGFKQEAKENYQRALKKQFGLRMAYHQLINLSIDRGQYEQTLDVYNRLEKIEEDSSWLQVRIAELYQKWRKHDQAIAACQRALKINPDYPDAHQLLGKIYYEQGQHHRAKASFQKALKFQPNNMWLRNYLKKKFPAQDAIFKEFSLSTTTCERIRKTKVSSDLYPESSAAHLLNQVITHVFEDGSYSTKQHVIVKILNEEGRDRFGSVQLVSNPSMKIHRAHTIKVNGEIVEPTSLNQGKISFSAVQPGVLIEYEYSYDGFYGGWLKGYYYSGMPFQTINTPMLNYEWIVALPKKSPARVHTQGNIKYQKSYKGKKIIHHWKAKNLEPIYQEILAPPYQELAAGAYISNIPSWEFMAKWEQHLIKDQFTLDQALIQKLSDLTINLKTKQEKIRALYNYVTKEIRYEHRNDGWIFGVKPQKAANVFADGFGVCKDKALLLVALYRQIDVPAYMALVKTNNYGHLIKDLPYSWFNHVIVYLPPSELTETGLFLDPTSNYTSFGDMWPYTQDIDAFIGKQDGYEFVRTPQLFTSEHISHDELILNSNGQAMLSGSGTLSGTVAAMMRYGYRIAGKRKEMLEKTISVSLPGAKVKEVDLLNWDKIDLPLKINYTIKIPHYVNIEGSKLYFNMAGIKSIESSWTEKSERRYDLMLDPVNNTQTHQTFIIPKNYKVVQLPQRLDLDTKWFEGKIKWTHQEGQAKVEHSWKLKVVRVKKKDYSAFRKACMQVDMAEKERVILMKKP